MIKSKSLKNIDTYYLKIFKKITKRALISKVLNQFQNDKKLKKHYQKYTLRYIVDIMKNF